MNDVTSSLAAVFRAVGEPFTLERFPIPALKGSEALVRIRCATICGSDLHSYFGRRHSPMPSVIGHEMALRFGAGVALDSTLEPSEITGRVSELSEGRGAGAGLEFAGYAESVELGIGLLCMGGRFVMAGATFPSRLVQLSAEQLVRRMIRITGVYNYAPEDLETARPPRVSLIP